MNRPDATDPKTSQPAPADNPSDAPAHVDTPRGEGAPQSPPAAPKRARNGKTRHASRR